MNQPSPTRFFDNLKAFNKKGNPFLYIALLSSGLGAAWFFYMYGSLPLVFSNIDWIANMGGDAVQHYLGWQFYRNAPWGFPLGNIADLGYPFGINLAYTDSIPLIAIPLKLLAPLLGRPFQYVGVWVLFNLIAQIFCAILIIRRCSPSLLHHILGGSLLAMAPIMLLRAWVHSSLNAQWVLLASIYLLLSGREKPVPWWAWPAVFCLELLIHPYFMFMSGILFAVYLLETHHRDRNIRVMLLPILASGIAVFAIGLISGVIEFPVKSAAELGYGYYSLNLNALVNPLNSSAWLAPRPMNSAFQWEGYNYPGAGYGLFIVIGAGWLIFSRRRKAWLNQNAILIAACFLLTLFAITHRVTLDAKVLLEIPLPQGLINSLGIFRSSGRFFWPVLYLMVIFGILRITRSGKWSNAILAFAFLLQFFDLAPLLNARDSFLSSRYQSPLQADFWQAARGSFRHIELLPAANLLKVYEPFGIYAAEQKMTLNWGYFARADYARIYAEGLAEVERLKSGVVSSDTIYLFCNLSEVHAIQSQSPRENIRFYQVDHYVLGLPTANAVTRKLPARDELSQQAVREYRLAEFISSFNDQTLFVISGKWTSFTGMDDETRQLLATFGLKADLPNSSEDGYVAVFGRPLGRSAMEQRSPRTAQASFAANERLGEYVLPVNLQVTSSSASDQDYSSIRLNDTEYSSNLIGINILAYDTQSRAVTAKNFNQLYPLVCP